MKLLGQWWQLAFGGLCARPRDAFPTGSALLVQEYYQIPPTLFFLIFLALKNFLLISVIWSSFEQIPLVVRHETLDHIRRLPLY